MADNLFRRSHNAGRSARLKRYLKMVRRKTPTALYRATRPVPKSRLQRFLTIDRQT